MDACLLSFLQRRAKAQEADEDLQQLTEEERQTEEALQSARLEAKKAEKEAEKEDKARKEAEEKQKKLKQNYTWIPSEESQFGREGSDYDFNNTSPEEKKQELQEAEKEHAQLERRVNKEVVSAWDSADAQYKELSTKRQALANDKEKIESVISELDGKKEEALRQTWEKVDADLASIFSLLLPGSSAKLEPEAGKSFLQGLEIKVQLGGTWKESLSELSGGQRSLLALSLILALLLFKPAPIYILDEVDAALDPSHTQNIGRMIREHFPFSQFIIVSLKEGMFSNANALFRTHFIDGSSTVVREAGERIEEEGREEADEKRTQSAKRRKQEVRSRKPLAEADGNAKVNS
jgi:structural maintenance of chromosome 2